MVAQPRNRNGTGTAVATNGTGTAAATNGYGRAVTTSLMSSNVDTMNQTASPLEMT
jgi:hypothetical protein